MKKLLVTLLTIALIGSFNLTQTAHDNGAHNNNKKTYKKRAYKKRGMKKAKAYRYDNDYNNNEVVIVDEGYNYNDKCGCKTPCKKACKRGCKKRACRSCRGCGSYRSRTYKPVEKREVSR